MRAQRRGRHPLAARGVGGALMLSLRDYDYDLPDDAIAQSPAEPRDSSKMLVLNKESGEIQHAHFRDLPDFLSPGDLIVRNNARVTALRLLGEKPSGGKVEALLLRDLGG